tara:strand:+ start:192 stop:467 length:276 start_codon:yes stop_codon:yes gene_type:complete
MSRETEILKEIKELAKEYKSVVMNVSKEIFKAEIQITDRGVSYPLQNPIEVHQPIEKNVKKFLRKNAHAMDLSSKFKFKITSVKSVGFGNI